MGGTSQSSPFPARPNSTRVDVVDVAGDAGEARLRAQKPADRWDTPGKPPEYRFGRTALRLTGALLIAVGALGGGALPVPNPLAA